MKVLLLSPYPGALLPALTATGTVETADGRIDGEALCGAGYDWTVVYGYRYLIREPLLSRYRNRIINLHISLLPWNRGADPNLWSWLEGTPKGVSLHRIDAGLDTGDLLGQRRLWFGPAETLASSY